MKIRYFAVVKALKTILTVLLLTTFIGSTNGVQIYTHYCGDFLADISILSDSHCGENENDCAADKEMKCCDDEMHFFQLDVDLQSPKVLQTNFQIPVIGIATTIDFTEDNINNGITTTFQPQVFTNCGIPIYKKLSRLTLYG